LVFFDDYDLFGEFAGARWNSGLSLYDNLAAAIQTLASRESLSRVLEETAANILHRGLLDRSVDRRTRERALGVLPAIGPDAAAAVPNLAEIIQDDQDDLLENAVAALDAIGPAAAPAVPRLIEIATADLANARARGIACLGSIGPAAAQAVPLLVDFLLKRVPFDPDPWYVSLAAIALGDIGAVEAVPALVQVLQDTTDPGDASTIIFALARVGPDAAAARPQLEALALGQFDDVHFPMNDDIQDALYVALQSIGLQSRFDEPDS
jgi:HEAT repeat protein